MALGDQQKGDHIHRKYREEHKIQHVSSSTQELRTSTNFNISTNGNHKYNFTLLLEAWCPGYVLLSFAQNLIVLHVFFLLMVKLYEKSTKI